MRDVSAKTPSWAISGDLPEAKAKVLYAVQWPFHKALLTGKTTQAAWRAKPSYYAVSTEDRTIDPDLQRFMAKRMEAKTIEVKASHLSLISIPKKSRGSFSKPPDREPNESDCLGRRRSRITSHQRVGQRGGIDLALFGTHFREHFLAGDQRLANQRRTDIADQMQDRFHELVLGPAVVARETDMQFELQHTSRGDIGDDADQGPGFEIKPGTVHTVPKIASWVISANFSMNGSV